MLKQKKGSNFLYFYNIFFIISLVPSKLNSSQKHFKPNFQNKLHNTRRLYNTLSVLGVVGPQKRFQFSFSALNLESGIISMLARSVLITGCNRGIGLELVKQWLKIDGPPEHIIATCRKPDEVKKVKKGICLTC